MYFFMDFVWIDGVFVCLFGCRDVVFESADAACSQRAQMR